MHAIVIIAGEQFHVKPADTLLVPLLEATEGTAVEFTNVLLLDGDGALKIGAPFVAGAKVMATVLGHEKGDKVLVFKKKKRKRYRRTRGHRQQFTQIKIDTISA